MPTWSARVAGGPGVVGLAVDEGHGAGNAWVVEAAEPFTVAGFECGDEVPEPVDEEGFSEAGQQGAGAGLVLLDLMLDPGQGGEAPAAVGRWRGHVQGVGEDLEEGMDGAVFEVDPATDDAGSLARSGQRQVVDSAVAAGSQAGDRNGHRCVATAHHGGVTVRHEHDVAAFEFERGAAGLERQPAAPSMTAWKMPTGRGWL